jgi:hypothetical protein
MRGSSYSAWIVLTVRGLSNRWRSAWAGSRGWT